jgi:hypothetical protein
MNTSFSRRAFVKTSLAAAAAASTSALPLVAQAEVPQSAAPGASKPIDTQPMGTIGGETFSRLMLGGNLIGGYAHSRDLPYVSTLMRRYNTESKIRETLELAEAQGVNVINTWVMQDNSALFAHWKNGGKMKWISQVRLEAGGFGQVDRAVDQGAVGIHLTGDTCEGLLDQGAFDKVGESIAYIRSKKRVAGVAAHDLRVIVECEKRKLDVDFYQKTLHTHEYYTAPKTGDTAAVGANDNSWCNDPQAVVDVMAKTTKPFIAFKILAAGAIPPRAAFPYAFNSGADFILVGMFDWQVEENCKLAKRVYQIIAGANSKRQRPWYG